MTRLTEEEMGWLNCTMWHDENEQCVYKKAAQEIRELRERVERLRVELYDERKPLMTSW